MSKKKDRFQIIILIAFGILILAACSGTANGGDQDNLGEVVDNQGENFEPESNVAGGEGSDSISAADLDYPVTHDAFDIQSQLNILVYKTFVSFEEVIGFYQAEMESLGWTRTGNQQATKPVTYLEFVGDDGEITIMVSAQEDTEDVVFVMLTHYEE